LANKYCSLQKTARNLTQGEPGNTYSNGIMRQLGAPGTGHVPARKVRSKEASP